MQQDEEQHNADLRRQAEENAVEQARTAMELQGDALKTAQEIRLKQSSASAESTP
jgi:hypothetical protein